MAKKNWTLMPLIKLLPIGRQTGIYADLCFNIILSVAIRKIRVISVPFLLNSDISTSSIQVTLIERLPGQQTGIIADHFFKKNCPYSQLVIRFLRNIFYFFVVFQLLAHNKIRTRNDLLPLCKSLQDLDVFKIRYSCFYFHHFSQITFF